MKYLDIENWNRKDHFYFFLKFEEPFFGVTVELDVTKLYDFCKVNDVSFYLSYLHRSLVAANRVQPFAYRISSEGKVEVYDVVHGSATVLRPDNSFGFSYLKYYEDFKTFSVLAAQEIEKVKSEHGLQIDVAPQNIVQLSALPWFQFTSMSHARSFSFRGSNPMISFGKVVDQDMRKKMPVSIHVHHGLMDGFHVGKFIAVFQELLSET